MANEADKSAFPVLPSAMAEWVPIYLEPIINSGEMFTVAVAAANETGEILVVPTLSEQQVLCAFGDAGISLLKSSRICIDSMHAHLTAGGTVNDWKPPFVGFSIGNPKRTESDDLTSLIRLAMSQSSSFSALSSDSMSQDDHEFVQEPEDRWPKLVRAAVNASEPPLDGYFDRRMTTVPNGKRIKFDFLGYSYAANFGKLVPISNRLSGDVARCRQKLWLLQSLRDADLTFTWDDFELIVLKPDDEDPMYSVQQIDAVKSNIFQLEQEARKEGLAVVAVEDADEAARRIIDAEAVA